MGHSEIGSVVIWVIDLGVQTTGDYWPVTNGQR